MVKKSRKQKGAGGAISKPPKFLELRYANRGLDNNGLEMLLKQYIPSEEEPGKAYVSLDVRNNNLTELPLLPLDITAVDCDGNQITALSEFSPFLISLSCNDNQLTVLPELPPRLKELYCNDNQLTFLPELPPRLKKVYCNDNELTVLPELPPELYELSCIHNQLTVIPELPKDLEVFDCTDNQLTVLPELPSELKSLGCSDNQLTVLPELPPNLEIFYCNDNQLTVLPELPESLIDIYFVNNPFIAPFDRFLTEFEEVASSDMLEDRTVATKELIDNVNGYYASERSKGRNLASMMQTFGRTELQGRYGLGNNNTPRNLEYNSNRNNGNNSNRNNSNGSRKARKVLTRRRRVLNTLPNGPLAHIGSFLTGERGSVNQQRNTLKKRVNLSRRPNRNRNEIAVN